MMSKGYTQSKILQGERVILEPINIEHADALFIASQNPDIWEWQKKPSFQTIDNVKQWIELAQHMYKIGEQTPYTILDAAKNIPIGTISYCEQTPRHKSLEISKDWIAHSYWKSNAEIEAKYLLLKQAFEELGCYRVQMLADDRDKRAQKQIIGIGAKKEGTKRSEYICHDGHRCNHIYYSILDYEWKNTKIALLEILK